MTGKFQLTRREALFTAAGGAIAATGLGSFAQLAHAAAPMLGVARPSFYRFKVGDFEVTTLLDGAVQLKGPYPIFGNNQPAEVAQKYAADNLQPTDKLEIPFTPTIVNTGKELVLFDTGNGAARRQAGAGKLLSRLPEAGYKPEQVDVVVITHGHPDHIGGLMEGGKPAFPNARYVIGETENGYWSNAAALPDARKANGELFANNVISQKDKTTFLKPDGEAVSGIRAVGAFGHTPGHMAYLVDSGGKQLLIWGDVSNHYVMSVQKPEWHVSFDVEKDKAVETRKRIFDMVATDKLPVVGYHMPPPALGFLEKRSDGGYRWVAAGYQLNL